MTSAITRNKIDGAALLELSDDHLSEIAPLIGDRIKLKRAIREAMLLSSSSSVLYIANYKSRYIYSYLHKLYMHISSGGGSCSPEGGLTDRV